MQAVHLNLDAPVGVREEGRRIVIEPIRDREFDIVWLHFDPQAGHERKARRKGRATRPELAEVRAKISALIGA